MCTFVTGTISAQVDLSALSLVSRAQGLEFRPVENPAVAAQLPKGRLYLFHVCGICDCGTGIGHRLWSSVEQKEFSAEAEVLRKKGWSQTKVDRWLDSKKASVHGRVLRETSKAVKEVRRYLDLARALLELPRVERFGLMHHFYAGDVESDEFKVKVLPAVSITEATSDHLLLLPGDTLQEFRL